jgi:hypothetical protein
MSIARCSEAAMARQSNAMRATYRQDFREHGDKIDLPAKKHLQMHGAGRSAVTQKSVNTERCWRTGWG